MTNLQLQWNAEIQASKNRKAPKTKCLTVWTLARSDFRRSGFSKHAKCVRNPNGRFGPKSNDYVVPNCPKSEQFSSDFEQFLFGFRTVFLQFGPGKLKPNVLFKNLTFCPIWALWAFCFLTEVFDRNPNKIIRI